MASVFPSGMAHMVQQNLDGMPMIMHNRQWSPVSDYVLAGSFEWLTSELAAIPRDPFAFFEWFFRQQDGWNLHMYEQDWLNKEYDQVESLHTNITLADDWLRGMARGLALSGRTQQYCMPYAYDILAASALGGVVTNARATNDYFHATDHRTWAIGATALFYAALEILPFKDGFYSSTARQVGGAQEGPETSPDREILVATLSAAMVGPMDGLGYVNASRVLASCRSDGVVLKPDRPLVLSDACFSRALPETCDVFAAFADLGEGQEMHHFLYVDDPDRSLVFNDTVAELLAPEAVDQVVAFNYYTRHFKRVTGNTALHGTIATPGYENHTYLLFAPLLDDWALVGEVDKYVPASALRFKALARQQGALHVSVLAAANETVGPVCAVYDQGGAMTGYDATTLVCNSVTNPDPHNEALLSLTFQPPPPSSQQQHRLPEKMLLSSS
mmetsp:Transcript_4727/g.14773  ORF Transcript_4727/g.14773 Transcript_4727/m.14773 type:complete len:444 (+) Transcript_4727:181-1512(+)